ncbi:MAG: MerR family transcriptional regulator, partial [Mycobacterium sp.]
NPGTPQRDRKRMVRLLIDDVTLNKTDRIHLHVRLHGGQTTSLTVAIPPKAWQLRQTHPDTLAALDRLLDTHTDAQTADALNAAGHRSGEGKPFTARIVLEARRSNKLPSHAERLRANGLLTKTELAARLGVHESTVKSWTKAGILNFHKANDKNERLYEPPVPGDPRLAARQGSPLRKRVST